MSRYPHKGLPLKKAQLDTGEFKKKSNAQIGTRRAPARIVVQTLEREAELKSVFEENGWTYEIKVDPEQDENIADLEFLQTKPESVTTPKLQGRNDTCACGSGKKFKKCCGA